MTISISKEMLNELRKKAFYTLDTASRSSRAGMHIRANDLINLIDRITELEQQPAPAVQGEPLRYTNDGALAECPCCGSLDVGGAHVTVQCQKCGLSVTKPRPLQNAIDAWNTRTGRTHPAPAVQWEPAAVVDADDGGMWADILPDVTVKVGQTLYAAPQPAPDVARYEEVLADQRRLIRELDVLLNGTEGAAKQASLCDLVAQLRAVVRKTGRPVLDAPDNEKMVPVPYELLRRLADRDFRSEVPDEWVPEMTGPDGSQGPASFTVGDLRAAAKLVRAFEGGEA